MRDHGFVSSEIRLNSRAAGSSMITYRIEGGVYVLVFARAADGNVLMIRQYKRGLGAVTITFPAGDVDHGEAPLQVAKRELVEETGYAASTWKELGVFVLDGTRHSGKAHCSLAEDLFPGTPRAAALEPCRHCVGANSCRRGPVGTRVASGRCRVDRSAQRSATRPRRPNRSARSGQGSRTCPSREPSGSQAPGLRPGWTAKPLKRYRSSPEDCGPGQSRRNTS